MTLPLVGFEHCHLHTHWSLLDGFGTPDEYASRAKEINQRFLSVSDHGMMGAIPAQIRACEENKINYVISCELYLQDKHPSKEVFACMSPAEKKEIKKSYHLLAIAYNNTGYRNLVQLSSWAWMHGFYYRPRVTHEQLNLHKEGIIFTSCCYNSEIGQAFERGGEEPAFEMIEKYHRQFGENFYLELMLLDFTKQKPYDAFIIKAHDKYHIPLLLTNDVHYCYKEDSKHQRYMIMIQRDTSIKEIEKKLQADDKAEIFELQDQNLWMKSEEEINAKWLESYQDTIPYDLFVQAKLNSVRICEKTKGVEIDRSSKLPQFPDANDRLKESLIQGLRWRGLTGRKYVDRIKEEYELICRKGFASYFLIQKQMTDEARRICPSLLGWGDGSEAVGPGRGCLSGDTSIVLGNGRSKFIRDMSVGDFVITRDGTAKMVEAVQKYPCNEDMVKLYCYYGDRDGVCLTKDHKVLAEKFQHVPGYDNWAASTQKARRSIEEPSGNLTWVEAREIQVGDWVFVPSPKTIVKNDRTVDLAKFCDRQQLHCDELYAYQDWMNPLTGKLRHRKKVVRRFELDNDWITVVGIFAGDGWLRSDGSGRVGFCFHLDDSYGLNLVRKKMENIGAEYTVVPRYKLKKCVQLIVNNRYMHRLFEGWFDNYEFTSQTKHVPEIIMAGDSEMKMAFLKGYHMADGNTSHCLKYSTTSLSLADQVRFLNWQVGQPASYGKCQKLDNRTGHKSTELFVKTPKVFDEDCKKYQFRIVDGGILQRIRKIETIQGVKEVYDLQVADNHNYLTTSFLVHNSAVGSLACFSLGITDVDPIRHGLLFSRFLSENRGGKSVKLKFTGKPR